MNNKCSIIRNNVYKDEYFIIGDVEVTLFAMARQLLGMEKFFLDIMMAEEHINVLLEKSISYLAPPCNFRRYFPHDS